MLATSLIWSGVHLVLNKLFNQTTRDSYFTEISLGSFGNVPVNKSRHYVLAILLGLLRDDYETKKWINVDTMC